mmetsp:Transcript_13786/g.33680  ORF Transcript_13786/g.33680 Transcript_13786/m.33680 type:complete len:100 (-) Transcript_13786:508-807(-)
MSSLHIRAPAALEFNICMIVAKLSSLPAASEQFTPRKGTGLIEQKFDEVGGVRQGYVYPYQGSPRMSFDGGIPIARNASSPCLSKAGGELAAATQGPNI